MKKLVSFSLVVLSFIVLTALKADVQPEFKFDEETHDFAKIPQGKPVSVEFKFTNVGDEPLILTNVEATCGCTVPEYSKLPVLKGQTGIVKATFNAAVTGPFIKQLTITSNARTTKKVLYLKGEVISATTSSN
ncbi:MAG: DUF1573 domain-containing protein [Pyrinomonadaceae bacterium]|nr:DUF1573 domain-containing protein [Sphingobacteriaceae bacterium]